MPTPNEPTTGTDDGGAAPLWVSVAAAAAALGISSKTVWRRARAGELTARKVAGERGGKVWEIALNPSGQTDRPTGQARPDTERPNDAQTPEIEREASGQTERPPSGQAAKASGQSVSDEAGAAAQFTAHLVEENRFLRATVEQLQRDGAEVRAALREALRAMPKALPPATPTDAPESPHRAPMGKDTRQAANGSGKGTERGESAPVDWNSVYASLADAIDQNQGK